MLQSGLAAIHHPLTIIVSNLIVSECEETDLMIH